MRATPSREFYNLMFFWKSIWTNVTRACDLIILLLEIYLEEIIKEAVKDLCAEDIPYSIVLEQCKRKLKHICQWLVNMVHSFNRV